jgi:hypothetical protein
VQKINRGLIGEYIEIVENNERPNGIESNLQKNYEILLR